MNVSASFLRCSVLLTIFVVAAAWTSGAGQAVALASPWVDGPKTKIRLVAGRAATGPGTMPVAFVEIALEPGWKTYWRTPGDAGGLPPSFDWSKSSNLARADVQFPAPQLFTDKSGNTIGYQGSLVLPVFLSPAAADKAMSLVVEVQYGICKDVCIPVEAELALDVALDADDALPDAALEALDRVPRAQARVKPGDPVLVTAAATLGGGPAKIRIEARFPGAADRAAVFIEAPDGLFLPLPERIGDGGDGGLVFEADLSRDVDLDALKGKTVSVTLVGETGASFATFAVR